MAWEVALSRCRTLRDDLCFISSVVCSPNSIPHLYTVQLIAGLNKPSTAVAPQGQLLLEPPVCRDTHRWFFVSYNVGVLLSINLVTFYRNCILPRCNSPFSAMGLATFGHSTTTTTGPDSCSHVGWMGDDGSIFLLLFPSADNLVSSQCCSQFRSFTINGIVGCRDQRDRELLAVEGSEKGWSSDLRRVFAIFLNFFIPLQLPLLLINPACLFFSTISNCPRLLFLSISCL